MVEEERRLEERRDHEPKRAIDRALRALERIEGDVFVALGGLEWAPIRSRAEGVDELAGARGRRVGGEIARNELGHARRCLAGERCGHFVELLDDEIGDGSDRVRVEGPDAFVG